MVVRVCRKVLLLPVLCALALALVAPSAQGADRIYWTSFYSGEVHWSNLDGSGGVHELNATGAAIATPTGYGYGGAIDPVQQRYYWTNQIDAKINWANLDGSGGGVLATTGATVSAPLGVSVDPFARRAYWANESNSIAYANLDGSGGANLNTGMASIFTPVATTVFPSAGRVYWTNFGFLTGSLSFAGTDGSGGQTLNVTGTTVDTPFGIAIDAARQRLYWANDNPGTISVANMDGSGAADIDRRGLEMKGPYGIALDPDAGIVYAANFAGNTLTALRVDGSGGATLPIALPKDSGPNFPVVYKDPRSTAAPTVTSRRPLVPKPKGKAKRKPAPLPKLLGSRLTCEGGAWKPDLIEARLYQAPASVSFTWTRDGVDLGPVAGTLSAGQVGNYRCRATGSNVAGATSATSGAVAILATGKVKLNEKKGTARLTTLLPGEPGELTLGGKGFKPVSRQASGRVTVLVKPKGAKKAELAERGRLKAIVKLTYTPPDGPAATLRKRLTLVQD